MDTVTLGVSGLAVSKLCFGTLTMSGLQTDMTPRDGARLLVGAYELGVNFLDTADLYATYPHIREALKSAPGYKISTKAYCWDEKTASDALLRARRGMGREYIDLFMLHEQESVHTLRGHEAALRFLNREKEKGGIGAVGVSTHHVACVRAAWKFGGIDVIHPIVNRTGVGIADGTIADMETAIAEAHAAGMGVLAMKPLGGGHLIGDAAGALRYVLDKPWVDSIALGMQSIDEIEANVALFEGRAADEGILNRIAIKPRRLMVHDWCEGCGRCVRRCGQGALRVERGQARVDEEKCVLCGYCAAVCPQFCLKVV